MNDDQETPAKTVELDDDVIDHALMTKDTERHGFLDGYAQVYQAAMSLVAATHQQEDLMAEAGLEKPASHARSFARSLTDSIIVHVRENHEHPVRWTVDMYDEIDYDE